MITQCQRKQGSCLQGGDEEHGVTDIKNLAQCLAWGEDTIPAPSHLTTQLPALTEAPTIG